MVRRPPLFQVEGGRIDHAHHRGWANLALKEVLEFDSAIETASSMTDKDETLTIVTADHSHVMSMAGYQPRGSDIRGEVQVMFRWLRRIC